MNREIKFRAWDIEYKRMYYNAICGRNIVIAEIDEEELSENNSLDTTYHTTANISEEHPKSFEVMQFTGLKDKNEKEVYDKDICEDEYGNRCEIIWNQDNCSFCADFSGELHELTNCSEWIKVVGNIYKNPELLQ